MNFACEIRGLSLRLPEKRLGNEKPRPCCRMMHFDAYYTLDQRSIGGSIWSERPKYDRAIQDKVFAVVIDRG